MTEKTARELMDDPDFIDVAASVEEVKNEVEGAENTLIVKDEDGKTVGEIHENSLLKILVPEDRLDEEKVIGILGLSFNQQYVAETAEDLMNHHRVTVDPEEGIGEIAFIMDREDVRALPVKEDGEIIGVVHEDSIVKQIHGDEDGR